MNQTMQERLSVAEGCMGERERELRAQVEKLQQTNMDLTRDLNINANVHSSTNHTIHTSQRMAAGLTWQNGDDVVHLREVNDGERKFSLYDYFLCLSIHTNMCCHFQYKY